jgi:hypothetical protein
VSTLFNVEVDEVEGTRAKLTLVSVHPDAGPFGKDKVFSLRLIHEPSFELTDGFESRGLCPLGDAIPYMKIMNEEWAHENAGRFIASVDVEPKDLPAEVPVDTVATYTIEVTDPKWIEHLKPGQTWHSATFS